MTDFEKAQYEEKIRNLTKDLETERMRLAACGVAALGYFPKEGIKEEYCSASLQDVHSLRDMNTILKENLAKAQNSDEHNFQRWQKTIKHRDVLHSALLELVACKNLKESIISLKLKVKNGERNDTITPDVIKILEQSYNSRKGKAWDAAWDAARNALSPPRP